MKDVPEYVLDNVALHLSIYANYRRQIGLARGLDKRFGGGGRYVDDTRRNLGAGLRAAASVLRDFTRQAKVNGVDPSAVMRWLWLGPSPGPERHVALAGRIPTPAP